MTHFITARPTGSFSLVLPAGICDQNNERVNSFWVDGKPLLIQISSYLRIDGDQVAAPERLAERMSKHSETWTVWEQKIHPDQSVDQATAEFADAEGYLWIHSYLVWPHLSLYVTVSGPEADVRKPGNWAIHAVQSLALTLQ